MKKPHLKLTVGSLVLVIAVVIGVFAVSPAFASPLTVSPPRGSVKYIVGATARGVERVSAHTTNVFTLKRETPAAALKHATHQLPLLMAHANKGTAARLKNAPVNHSPLAAGLSGPSANTTIGFPGMADSATICPYFGGCQPPDMALATSPTRVLQGVNTSYAFYNTSGALVLGPINDVAWYGVPALPNNCDPAGPFLSDPRAFYDPNTKLFWTATLQVESAAFGVGVNCPNMSLYWIANINPTTGVMHVYSFDMTLGGTVNAGADYTEFGFSNNVVAFTGNMFDFTTGNFDFSEGLFVNKQAMQKGLPVTANAFTQFSVAGPNGTVLVDTVQPVETITTVANDPGVEYLINAFNINGDPFGDDCFARACQGFVVWAYDPSNGTLGGTLEFSQVPSVSYLVPPNADEPGCFQCVETIDTRITATPVYSVGGGQGLISFSLDTALTNGGTTSPSTVPGLLWAQMQVTHFSSLPFPQIYQAGYISFPGDQAASFGALMQAGNGRLVMVFDTMSANLNPSIMVASRNVSAPLGTLGNARFIIKGPSATFDSRWGDYEAASYDGFSTNHIWVASQYSVSGDWNTFIARV